MFKVNQTFEEGGLNEMSKSLILFIILGNERKEL